MLVTVKAKIITGVVYDKRNKETNELTGEKGLMVTFLVDSKSNSELSGSVISPYVASDYSGPFDLSNFKRLDDVELILDTPMGPKGMFVLRSMAKIGG